jgi:hypothetical protein
MMALDAECNCFSVKTFTKNKSLGKHYYFLQSRQNLLDMSCLGGSFPEQQAIKILFGSRTEKHIHHIGLSARQVVYMRTEKHIHHIDLSARQVVYMRTEKHIHHIGLSARQVVYMRTEKT